MALAASGALVAGALGMAVVSVGTAASAIAEPGEGRGPPAGASNAAGPSLSGAMDALHLTEVLGILSPVAVATGALIAGVGPSAPPWPTTAGVTFEPTVVAATPPSPPTPVAARKSVPGPVGARCMAALADVERTGLVLPALFEYRCPGSTETFTGDRQHWGTTCAMVSMCPGSAYIAVNPGLIGPRDARLRYVVAHETCHALDSVALRPASERAADACAAAHGFPRT